MLTLLEFSEEVGMSLLHAEAKNWSISSTVAGTSVRSTPTGTVMCTGDESRGDSGPVGDFPTPSNERVSGDRGGLGDAVGALEFAGDSAANGDLSGEKYLRGVLPGDSRFRRDFS